MLLNKLTQYFQLTNGKISKLLNKVNITFSRLGRAGHLKRMVENEVARRIMKCKLRGIIGTGQTKCR